MSYRPLTRITLARTGEVSAGGRRHRRERLVLRIASVVLAVSSVVALAGAAHAQAFFVSLYGVTGAGGAGEAEGTITLSATNLKRFTWEGWIDDICPGDSTGMELKIDKRGPGGFLSSKGGVMIHEQGCMHGKIYTPGPGNPVPYSFDTNIRDIRAMLWKTVNDNPTNVIHVGQWKYSPYCC